MAARALLKYNLTFYNVAAVFKLNLTLKSAILILT
jgi:hypothetical protein